MNGADVQNTNEGLFPLSYSELYLSPSSAPARSGSHAQHQREPSNQEPSCSSQPTCASRERSLDAGAPIAAAPHCAAPVQPRGREALLKGVPMERKALLRAAAAHCLPALPNRPRCAVLCIRETQTRGVIDSPPGSAMKNVWNYSCKVPLTHGSFVRTLKQQRSSAAYPLFAICSHLLS